MKYTEEYKDLFSVDDNYYLAHCISADFGMGKGIVIEFNKRFDMKNKLKKKYPNYINEWYNNNKIGDCIKEDNVLNLITKERYFNKPTYKSIEIALLQMYKIALEFEIKKIAMPMIGCGLDRLEWNEVSKLIKNIFQDTDIEFLVCKQGKEQKKECNTCNFYAKYEGVCCNSDSEYVADYRLENDSCDEWEK